MTYLLALDRELAGFNPFQGFIRISTPHMHRRVKHIVHVSIPSRDLLGFLRTKDKFGSDRLEMFQSLPGIY